MRLAFSQLDHGAPEQLRDAFDDVAVSHRNPKDREAGIGRCAAEKRAVAFEDSDEPVEFEFFYASYMR
jgi:hypothetical protein